MTPGQVFDEYSVVAVGEEFHDFDNTQNYQMVSTSRVATFTWLISTDKVELTIRLDATILTDGVASRLPHDDFSAHGLEQRNHHSNLAVASLG